MRSYLARQDVYRSIFARYPEDGEILAHGRGNFILRAASESRTWMQATLTRGLEDSPDVARSSRGMALGVRHETPTTSRSRFSKPGTLHLFAVAGLHVGIIAQILWILASTLPPPADLLRPRIIPIFVFLFRDHRAACFQRARGDHGRLLVRRNFFRAPCLGAQQSRGRRRL